MNKSDQGMPAIEDRRRSVRHRIILQASVLVSAINNLGKEDSPYFVFQGQLWDVSLTGLGIIISFEDRLELELLGEDVTLRFLLPLPVQAIELDATPVRYQALKENEKSDILVGAQITNMNGRDRIIFMEFIRSFEAEK